jgi:uncharacterized protein YyaL (SSP411 family)
VNRLGHEHSPYLLQHANNPVDWYPWGDEAFAAARSADKPIFLSIGYSTCHWCHVMEHESFEDEAIARVLNDHYVAVKVDREERPDVDRVYMTFIQGTTGSGGWPMSVWLTPDLKPFFGGTYFPPSARWGRPGFVDILNDIARVWQTERAKIDRSADSVTEQLRGSMHASVSASLPSVDALERLVSQFRGTYDTRHGGFGGAPKFPRPSELLFLLRESVRGGHDVAQQMAVSTLRAMSLGGLRDHVGGGFHRYSVDEAWRVPHFEKMLYDQAQLVQALVEAAQVSGDAFHMQVAEDTLRYVIREMTGPGGGFYSAEDADSIPPEQVGQVSPHKSEGAYYLWEEAEIDQLAGAGAPIVKARYGIQPQGNAPQDPQGEFTGKNLLYIARGTEDLSKEFGQSETDIIQLLGRVRITMFQARLGRPHPHLDDKILTAWNGLMIGAFARTAAVLQRLGADGHVAAAPHVSAARHAAQFIHDRMWDLRSGTLYRRFRDDNAAIDGYAEDYAYLISGVLALFQADPQVRWLEWAVALQKRQDELFWDETHGGWFSTTGRDASVLVRMKEDYDGAEPTASSVSVMNLLWLSHLVENPDWSTRIERTLRLFTERIEQLGRAVPMMAAAMSTYAAGITQVVIAGEDRIALERAIGLKYRPFTLVLSLTPAQQAELAVLAPWIGQMTPVDGRATAFVCTNFTCQAPIVDPEELDRVLA